MRLFIRLQILRKKTGKKTVMSNQSEPASQTPESSNARGFGERGLVGSMIVLLGRVLFSAIFFESAPRLLAHPPAALPGVPLAPIAIPLAGVIALVGAASVLLGYRAKIGGWLLVLFLVPVTFTLHNFWAAKDQAAAMQMVMFMKNISILGGALLISQFGAGPLSLDAWRNSRR